MTESLMKFAPALLLACAAFGATTSAALAQKTWKVGSAAQPGSVLITFVVGLAAVAWLLRFLTHHGMYWFVGYRVVLALIVMALLATGTMAAT
jgi:undecaprenyl pyrophosphate phosphatase UppP